MNKWFTNNNNKLQKSRKRFQTQHNFEYITNSHCANIVRIVVINNKTIVQQQMFIWMWTVINEDLAVLWARRQCPDNVAVADFVKPSFNLRSFQANNAS